MFRFQRFLIFLRTAYTLSIPLNPNLAIYLIFQQKQKTSSSWHFSLFEFNKEQKKTSYRSMNYTFRSFQTFKSHQSKEEKSYLRKSHQVIHNLLIKSSTHKLAELNINCVRLELITLRKYYSHDGSNSTRTLVCKNIRPCMKLADRFNRLKLFGILCIMFFVILIGRCIRDL